MRRARRSRTSSRRPRRIRSSGARKRRSTRATRFSRRGRASAVEVVRIDKWLWAARFYKTRSAATDAVLGGHVRLNDARVKPSREVKAGDIVEVKIGHLQWTVVVRGISAKRGPASVAATLYDETLESAAERERRLCRAAAVAADRRRSRGRSGRRSRTAAGSRASAVPNAAAALRDARRLSGSSRTAALRRAARRSSRRRHSRRRRRSRRARSG